MTVRFCHKKLRKTLEIVALVFLILASQTTVFGQQYSMYQAVQKALASHPQLKLAKSDIAIAQARLIDAGKLENPFLEFALASQLKDGPDREGSMFVGYSQSFPVTNKLLRQRDLSKAAVRVACAEVHEIERQFIAQVQESYLRALGAQALIAEMKRIENATEKCITLARNQVAAALGSELDVAAAETEKVLATQDRVIAEGTYRQALATLKSLLSIPSQQPLTLTDNLSLAIGKLQSTTKNRASSNITRTDVAAAQVRKQQAVVDQQLAQAETLEDWEFNAGYEAERTVDEPIGAERDRILSLGIKMPLPVRKQGEGRIAETLALSKKADYEITLAQANQRAEIASALAEVQATQSTAKSLEKTVLPQLKARENKTWQAYREGLTNFNQIILLQQQQTRTKKVTTQARVAQALALSRLQHALGSHPALKVYNPHNCQLYANCTEPVDAPWVLQVPFKNKVVKPVRATPVYQSKSKQPLDQKSSLKQFGQKLFGKSK